MPKEKTIIVIGAAHGGMQAAAHARSCNEVARIILFDDASFLGHERPHSLTPLKGQESFSPQMVTPSLEAFCTLYGLELRRFAGIKSLDPDARCLLIDNSGDLERLPFDALIFAGNVYSDMRDVGDLHGPRVVKIPGGLKKHVIDDAISEQARNALVIGCGHYGIEAALALNDAGMKVTILDRKMRIMPDYSIHFAHAMVAKLEEAGIVVKLGQSVTESRAETDDRQMCRFSGGEVVVFDLVLVSVGLTPEVKLLEQAGAGLDLDGLIRVDDHMATTIPHVYACGLAIKVPFVITGERKWSFQSTTLLKTAQVAGHNAALGTGAAKKRLKPFCHTMMLALQGTYFARTGLSEPEARAACGDENLLITTVFEPADEHSPTRPTMCVRLVIEKKGKRIVGGEVFGRGGVDGRISLLSVAVMDGWSPEKLLDVDMAQSEGGFLFDPLKEAAARAQFALEKNPLMISAETLALWLKSERDFRLVDVGDAPMLSGRTAKSVVHLPLTDLRTHAFELKASELPIVLYSPSGQKSHLAQRALMQRGISNIYCLDGGRAAFDIVFSKE